jgi:translation initiation factor 2 beta subunit (eIF-2beta)/eIF-5
MVFFKLTDIHMTAYAQKIIKGPIMFWSVALLIAIASSLSPDVRAADAPASDTKALDAVEVTGRMEKLRVMREEAIKIEDKFYDEYNKLNTDKQYSVTCTREAPLGTRLKYRVCRPEFVTDATSDEARSFLDGTSAPPADMVINSKLDDYKKNVLKVINSNPKLLKLVREREAIEKRYQAARKKKFKGKWIIFE